MRLSSAIPPGRHRTAELLFVFTLLIGVGGLLATGADARKARCSAKHAGKHKTLNRKSCGKVIIPKPGVKTVHGTKGSDTIYAPPSVSTVTGGAGNDKIYVAPDGGTTVNGGKGADLIAGELPPAIASTPIARAAATTSCTAGCALGPGSDTFNGGAGNDLVYGNRGSDTLNGGGGNDFLSAGLGDDTVNGGVGNDTLSGGWGADDIDGQSGNDYVRGDGTIDTIVDSGGGTDTLSYATGVTPGFPDAPGYPSFLSYPNFPSFAGERGVYLNLTTNVSDNTVAPFGGGVDTIAGSNFENIIGTPFSDYIVGTSANNVIWGGGGADVILGSGGNDVLYGGTDGDHLDGGPGANSLSGNAGSDYCVSPSAGSSCESNVNTGGVVLRDPTKVSVGFMAPEASGYSELYVTGSNVEDMIGATYSSSGRVTFSLLPGSASAFDQSPSASAGCSVGPTQAICTLSKPLDAVVIAGMEGNDVLQATNFPLWTSVVATGGEGNDQVTGGSGSEDVLVDGVDVTAPGSDLLSGLGGDDALLNNGGADTLNAGDGNDLVLSTAICNGDQLNGGTGSDNASWAKFKDSGVEARLAEGVAGRPGGGSAPDCADSPLDSLQEIEDLEGSSQADALYGDAGINSLLGRAGGDLFYAREGNDTIRANAADLDPKIDCGSQADTAVIDFSAYGDVPVGCETVKQVDSRYTG